MRIKDIDIDTSLSGDEYLLGSDTDTGGKTRNYKLRDIGRYVLRDSEFANEGKGGYHTADNITARNNIPEERREFGMICYVVSEDKEYRLTTNNSGTITDNGNWEEVEFGEDAPVKSVNNKIGNVTITKSDVGLDNVTNDRQVKASEVGEPDGVAPLDSNGLVPSDHLPAYVDEVDISLYLDPSTNELRANVSDFSEKYIYTGGVQEFVLTSTPGKIIYISVNGQLLEDPLTQWSIDVPTKTITILDEMDAGDRVTIHYQYIITI